MRLTRSTVLFLMLAASAVVACGGNGGSTSPDAKVFMDAPMPDAPGGGELTGLGKKCVPAMQGADCPQGTDGCLTFGAGATMGMCTKLCVGPTPAGTFMTNAQAQIGTINPDPATRNSICSAAYTGTIGTSICGSLVNVMPADNPLQANKNYTFLAACTIQCGAGNTCPTGYTCNAAAMRCQP